MAFFVVKPGVSWKRGVEVEAAKTGSHNEVPLGPPQFMAPDSYERCSIMNPPRMMLVVSLGLSRVLRGSDEALRVSGTVGSKGSVLAMGFFKHSRPPQKASHSVNRRGLLRRTWA